MINCTQNFYFFLLNPRRQETRGRNTAVPRPVWAHLSFRSLCDYQISMQLLFTFALMAILLKSVKLHSSSLHICLLIIYQCRGGEYRSVIDWDVKNN